MGCLKSTQDIWIRDKGELSVDNLLKHIQNFCEVNKHDDVMKELLFLLLDTNETKRRSPQRMLQMLMMLLQKKSFSLDLKNLDISIKKIVTHELDDFQYD